MFTFSLAVIDSILLRFGQLVHGANGAVVDAAARLLTDKSDFADHPEAITHQTYLASFVVVPTNGYFAESQSGLKREIEQFDIEPETIDSCSFDQWPARRHVECLEAALRIPERQPRRKANDEIKNPSALFTPPRLMDADQLAVQRA